MSGYETYLRSNWWQCRRYQAFEEAGWCCEKCGKRGRKHPYHGRSYGLEAHHLSYKRLGRERRQDLQVVCRDCHHEIHGYVGDLDYGLLRDILRRAETEAP